MEMPVEQTDKARRISTLSPLASSSLRQHPGRFRACIGLTLLNAQATFPDFYSA
jgi:hypothetical protein